MSSNCGCRVTLDDLANYVTWQALEARLGGPVPIDVLSDLQAGVAALRHQLEGIKSALHKIDERQQAMSAELDADFDQLNNDLNTLATGYQAQAALIVQLQGALSSADADKAQAVADAVAAEDSDIAAKVTAADAIAAAVLAPPAPPAG